MPAMLVEKNRRIGIIRISPINQVAPHCFAGRLTQVHRPPFAALRPSDRAMLHHHLSCLQADVPTQRFAQFHAAQTDIGQLEDERLVSLAK